MNTQNAVLVKKTAMEFSPFQLDALAVPDSQSIFSDLFDYSSMAGAPSSAFIDSPVGMAIKQESSLLGGDLFAEDLYSGFLSESLGSEHDWLSQSLPLPTPDEQKGDRLSFTSPTPPCTTSFTLPLLPTPEASLPGSPLSHQSSPTTSFYSEEDEAIYDAMTSLLGSEEMQGFVPNQTLPLSSPFAMASAPTPPPPPSSSDLYCCSPPQDSFLPSSNCRVDLSPLESFLPSSEEGYSVSSSPALSGLSATSPIMVEEEEEGECIRGLLKAEPEPQSSSRKRKLLVPQEEVKATRPAPKRRMSKATKRERKREQNKTAALRYRQRKKGEKSEVDDVKQELEEKNSSLRSTVDSLEAEISYLKQLWAEIEKRKRQ